MQTIRFDKTREIQRKKQELEKKLEIKIQVKGKNVTFSSDALNEYEATKVFDALNFGFSIKKALALKEEMTDFRIINIKGITRKKNLETVRGRVIGREGKTKKTIENITNCEIIVKENEIGIIGDVEKIDEVVTAIGNLVRGTKQSNTYRYLEKMNKRRGE